MAFNCAAPPSRPPSPPTFFVPFPGCLPLPPSVPPSSIPFPFSPLCATKLRSLALSGAARARGGWGPFRGTSGYSARRRATGWHNLVAGRDLQSWDASTLFFAFTLKLSKVKEEGMHATQEFFKSPEVRTLHCAKRCKAAPCSESVPFLSPRSSVLVHYVFLPFPNVSRRFFCPRGKVPDCQNTGNYLSHAPLPLHRMELPLLRTCAQQTGKRKG